MVVPQDRSEHVALLKAAADEYEQLPVNGGGSEPALVLDVASLPIDTAHHQQTTNQYRGEQAATPPQQAKAW